MTTPTRWAVTSLMLLVVHRVMVGASGLLVASALVASAKTWGQPPAPQREPSPQSSPKPEVQAPAAKPAETKKPPAKKSPKPPPLIFTTPEDAGPDIQVQGEYVGLINKTPWAAQVVGRNEGQFEVVLLAGGLPGDGWDQTTRLVGKATLRDGMTTGGGVPLAVAAQQTDTPPLAKAAWQVSIVDGQLSVTFTPEEMDQPAVSGRLARVVRRSPTEGAKPPPGAVVLYDGTSLDHWLNAKTQDTPNGPSLLAGTRTRRDNWGDFTLHIEWQLVYMPRDRANRSNSGIFLDNYYELQILDSFGQLPEKHGCGALYTYTPPRLNMCYPPLQWQTYDIEFTAPRFDEAGRKTANARVSVRHNGVVIHDNAQYPKGTNMRPDAKPTGGAIHLQNHGSPVTYRNIWIVEKTPTP